ncbi:MAG: aconitate hydratase, partial [Hyphomicrobiales bacterium]
ITSLPHFDPLPDALTLPVLLKMRDDVSTDEILPAGAKALPYRSNLQKIANFSFERIDPSYVDHARAIGQTPGHAVIAGKNYGQGSSREHAAAAPRYLGLRMVIAKGFARIHRQNLINYGVLPLVFINDGDYDRLAVGDTLCVVGLRRTLPSSDRIVLRSANATIEARHGLTSDQVEVILAGGVVNFRRGNMNEERGDAVLTPTI